MKRGPSIISSSPKRQKLIADQLLRDSMRNRDAQGIKNALKQGANPNGVMGAFPRSFLQDAIRNNDLPCVQALVEAEAIDINYQPIEGKGSALHEALFENNNAMLELLLTKGANANIYDMDNGTPLLHAVEKGNLEAARLLLAHGADPLISGYHFKNALVCALVKKNKEMLELFYKHGLKLSDDDLSASWLLKECINSGDEEFAKSLIDHGANLSNIRTMKMSVQSLLLYFKLKFYIDKSEESQALVNFFNALVNKDFEQVEVLISNPVVMRHFEKHHNQILQHLTENEQFPFLRRLLVNRDLGRGFALHAAKALAKVNQFTFELLEVPSVKALVSNNIVLADMLFVSALSQKRYLEAVVYLDDYDADEDLIVEEETGFYLTCYLLNNYILKTETTLNEDIVFQIVKTIAFVMSQQQFQENLKQLVKERASDFSAQSLQLLQSITANTYDNSYVESLEFRLLDIKCNQINKYIVDTEANLNDELIRQISNGLAELKEKQRYLSNYKVMLERIVKDKAHDYSPETLKQFQNILDNTDNESYIESLEDRLLFLAEERPLEKLGGKTLRQYVQKLQDKKPFSERFEEAKIEYSRNAPFICPISHGVIDVPVSISEQQEVVKNAEKKIELKTFFFDYALLKSWYKQSHTNPLTRKPFHWSDVQPATKLLKHMNKKLREAEQKAAPVVVEAAVIEAPALLHNTKHKRVGRREITFLKLNEILEVNRKRRDSGAKSPAKRIKR